MARRYNLRSLEAVAQLIRQEEDAIEPLEDTSDDENLTEEESGSESEQSAESDNEQVESESEVESEESDDDDTRTAPASKKPRNTERRESRGRGGGRGSSGGNRGRRKSTVVGKNGHKWYTTPRQRLSDRGAITTQLPTPLGPAKEVKSPYESWSLYFDEAMLSKIVRHTNEEIDRWTDSREINRQLDNIYKHVDVIELKAFIGLLYFSGLQKTNMTSLDDLWDLKIGCVRYRAVMAQKRFKAILQFLRFDDKNTRAVRRVQDKFAPIREIWESFIEKCRTLYSPSNYCTIDEQLLSFRGRCPFKVYNGQKPDKYGVMEKNMNDAKTFYLVNSIPYVGKVTLEDKTEKVPSYYIRKLSEPIHGSSRNITCDNWFSSTEIFDTMLEKNLTMVGTLKKKQTSNTNFFQEFWRARNFKICF